MGHGDSDELVAPEIPRLAPAAVAGIVRSGGGGSIIVDVREPGEVAEGKIQGSLNVPASIIKAADTSAFDALIKEQISGAQEVIVHCHFSKVRGPTCAKALNERLKALGITGPEVKVLAGGVAGFMDEFKGDAALVQLPANGWDPAQK